MSTPTPSPTSTQLSSSSGTDPIIQALVNILQVGANPQTLQLQQALLRRLILESDAVPSRLPAPKNITEVGGYINLVSYLRLTNLQTELLASALGIASPQIANAILYGTTFGPLLVTPSNPATTNSTTLVMAGLALQYTPVNSTRLKVTAQVTLSNSVAGDGGKIQISYGTGTAPSNGSALTGTQLGQVTQTVSPNANGALQATTFSLVTNVDVGTPYWFDLAYAAVNGGVLSVSNITIIIEEF
ncbi:MAG: hypothetical protein KGI02_05005 [Thaumarchaeota archaeon]|nr:hypothetical protein [Nitrososphaerota archaeon]